MLGRRWKVVVAGHGARRRGRARAVPHPVDEVPGHGRPPDPAARARSRSSTAAPRPSTPPRRPGSSTTRSGCSSPRPSRRRSRRPTTAASTREDVGRRWCPTPRTSCGPASPRPNAAEGAKLVNLYVADLHRGPPAPAGGRAAVVGGEIQTKIDDLDARITDDPRSPRRPRASGGGRPGQRRARRPARRHAASAGGHAHPAREPAGVLPEPARAARPDRRHLVYRGRPGRPKAAKAEGAVSPNPLRDARGGAGARRRARRGPRLPRGHARRAHPQRRRPRADLRWPAHAGAGARGADAGARAYVAPATTPTVRRRRRSGACAPRSSSPPRPAVPGHPDHLAHRRRGQDHHGRQPGDGHRPGRRPRGRRVLRPAPPRLQERFGVDLEPGLHRRAARRDRLNGAVQRTSANVYVVSAGSPPPNPSELLSTEKAGRSSGAGATRSTS